jgi:hypothetical protein
VIHFNSNPARRRPLQRRTGRQGRPAAEGRVRHVSWCQPIPALASAAGRHSRGPGTGAVPAGWLTADGPARSSAAARRTISVNDWPGHVRKAARTYGWVSAGKPAAPAGQEGSGPEPSLHPTEPLPVRHPALPLLTIPYPTGTPMRLSEPKSEGSVHKVHALTEEKSPDLGKLCARGGTRTGFPPPQRQGSRENMPDPARSGRYTARYDGESAHMVHTP